jgi:cytochrome c biogenesis protein CcmG/thiol:disulfide interchange protein DsbE
MTMHGRRWAIGLVLAGTLMSQTSRAAVPAGCDPKAKTANLGFTLKDIAGKDVALGAYKGKVILLDFWATWCAPCKVEIPWFVEFYKKYQSQGFVVLGVSIDDSVEKLKPFVAQYKMNYPVLIGDGRDDMKDAYGPLIGFPTSVLIARDGTICRTHIGYAPKEQFERDLKALLPAS